MVRRLVVVVALVAVCCTGFAADNPFVGRWALIIPGGGAGWLGITDDGYLDGSILWGGGSVVPVSFVWTDKDQETLHVTRIHEVERKNEAGEVVRVQQLVEHISATIDGDEMKLVQTKPWNSGNGVTRAEFAGKRIPPLPDPPDLSKLKFGGPITLFDGKSLKGWTLTNENQKNGWSAADGVLRNDPVQEEGKPHISYGNLRTVDEFEDFNLKLDVKLIPDGNSGIYLRGIYEVQVADSYGNEPSQHGMGAVYSRVVPSTSAEKPAGQWQTYDITLVDRHLTVVLNDTMIHDNVPLLGCTGGALWSDEFKPGPIYLQGDHTGVEYRNMVLTPIVR